MLSQAAISHPHAPHERTKVMATTFGAGTSLYNDAKWSSAMGVTGRVSFHHPITTLSAAPFNLGIALAALPNCSPSAATCSKAFECMIAF
jgi:hypothetical protein